MYNAGVFDCVTMCMSSCDSLQSRQAAQAKTCCVLSARRFCHGSVGAVTFQARHPVHLSSQSSCINATYLAKGQTLCACLLYVTYQLSVTHHCK